ncbi:MAG: hypothetical protein WA673_10075, partial [Candidatus Acidiferrales bacterium]
MVQHMSEPEGPTETSRFSLVSGGLLFQLFRHTRLSGDELEFLPRRMLAVCCLAWLPLLILSALAGTAWGSGIEVPFLYDFDTNIRFLIALPVLIAAEVVVHASLSPSLQRFVTQRIVREEGLPAFRSAINSALRLRNLFIAEIALIIFVFTAGHWIWLSRVAL